MLAKLATSLMRIVGNSDGTLIGNVSDRLKVDTVTTSAGLASTYSCKLRYVDMNASSGGVARGTSVTNAAWTTVFSYTGSGVISTFMLNLETKSEWLIRFIVDGDEIFDPAGLAMNDMVGDTIYDLDISADNVGENLLLGAHDTFHWGGPLSIPVKYQTGVSILVRRTPTKASKKFQAGLIILTKET